MAEPKLTPEQRREVLRRLAAGESIAALAREYPVCESSIRKIWVRAKAAQHARSEGKEQSFLENARWAMAAAGEFLRTKKRPSTCPNDAAWFLYCQAIENPKDFLGRVGQAESKVNADEEGRQLRINGERSIAELDEMLRSLEEKSRD